MITGTREALTLVAALGCGVVGGVFFAFSTFVMTGLARLTPAQGIVAMQSINRAAINPSFMIALFGTALACFGLAVRAAIRWGEPGTPWTLAAAAVYLAGAVAVTIAANVPRNESLAGVDAEQVAGSRVWASYVPSWTAWNHVRTVASVVAAALLVVALLEGRSD